MQVIAKNQYAVRVHNLPEHELVILKMIFAISQKSSARANHYFLAADPAVAGDIVIRGDDASITWNVTAPELRVVDVLPGDTDTPVLLRPLIATRVLAVLDDVIAHIAQVQTQSAPSSSGVVVQFKAAPPAPEQAIVDDESAGHPDNFSDTTLSAHNGDAVAAAVDALLLSTPTDDPDPVLVPEREMNTATRAPVSAPRRRALVIVESAAVRKQLEIELKFFDVDVDFAASARRAIEMFEAGDYAISIVDAVLPEWDGFRICKRMKARNPKTAVLMLLAQMATGDKLKGTLSGCDGYLVKPVGRLTFQTLVRNFLPVQAGARQIGAES